MDTLITSSPKTKSWLFIIESNIKQKNSKVRYNETKYWASFKSSRTDRNVAYLQPQKNQIRIFVRLEPSADSVLQKTPASHNWATMYPALFTLESETLMTKAVELILCSFEEDLRKGGIIEEL